MSTARRLCRWVGESRALRSRRQSGAPALRRATNAVSNARLSSPEPQWGRVQSNQALAEYPRQTATGRQDPLQYRSEKCDRAPAVRLEAPPLAMADPKP